MSTAFVIFVVLACGVALTFVLLRCRKQIEENETDMAMLRKFLSDEQYAHDQLKTELAVTTSERDAWKENCERSIAAHVRDGNALRDRIAELEGQLAPFIAPEGISGYIEELTHARRTAEDLVTTLRAELTARGGVP